MTTLHRMCPLCRQPAALVESPSYGCRVCPACYANHAPDAVRQILGADALAFLRELRPWLEGAPQQGASGWRERIPQIVGRVRS